MRALIALIFILFPGLTLAGEFFTLKGHGGPIRGIAVAPDGQIATASFDNSVGLWTGLTPDWQDGHAAAVNTVLFAHGVLYSAGDDFTLRRWPEGDILGTHKGKIMGLAAAPGLIATASWDGTIGLWPLDGSPARQLTGHKAGVNAIAFSRDHQTLYSASVDGTLRAWNVATGQQTRIILRHGFGINELVLGNGWLAYGSVDGVTRMIDLTTDTPIADFTLDRRPILALALSPGGQTLAVGDGEGFIMIIDTQTQRITRDFRATLRGPVWALAFSPDGQNIHAGGIDDVMYCWPLDQLTEHGQMANDERTFLKKPGEMSNGERQFARKCSICHALSPDSKRRAGPTLYNVFGRRAGTVADYSYSDILDGSAIVWSDETIDALFDLGPDHYIPGSKMPMQRITNPADRADLIAYLHTATRENTE